MSIAIVMCFWAGIFQVSSKISFLGVVTVIRFWLNFEYHSYDMYRQDSLKMSVLTDC